MAYGVRNEKSFIQHDRKVNENFCTNIWKSFTSKIGVSPWISDWINLSKRSFYKRNFFQRSLEMLLFTLRLCLKYLECLPDLLLTANKKIQVYGTIRSDYLMSVKVQIVGFKKCTSKSVWNTLTKLHFHFCTMIDILMWIKYKIYYC